MAVIKLLIVDDHGFFRRSLMPSFENECAINVVGTARNGAEAIALCQSLKPNIVLMDLNMPFLSGLAAMECILPTEPPPAILILTADDTPETVMKSLAIGARGYLRKDLLTDEVLLTAIFIVAQGGIFIDPQSLWMLRTNMGKIQTH